MSLNKCRHGSKEVKSKKPLLVIASVILLIVIGSSIAYAYLTSKKQVENDITLGYNKISLNENYEPPVVMSKGIEFRKEPYVTNMGNVDCYVRVKSVISDSRAGEGISLDYKTEYWTYNNNDGYWYYYKAIEPGESTEFLFTKVTVAEDAPDIVLDGFDVFVYAESIQTEDGKTMEEMWNN